MVIELKNEKVTVQFKEFGGALSSIKDQDGIEYLWQGNPAYWSSQAPVLFPICGSLRNDKGIYTSKKHSHRMVASLDTAWCERKIFALSNWEKTVLFLPLLLTKKC